jgi:hypothetical protein
MRKRIEPENCVGNKPNEHETRDALERKGVVPATSAIFDSTNVPFNVRNVLILSAEVEADWAEGFLKRLEFRICKDRGDTKAPAMIDSEHTLESSDNGVYMTIWKVLDRAEV